MSKKIKFLKKGQTDKDTYPFTATSDNNVIYVDMMVLPGKNGTIK